MNLDQLRREVMDKVGFCCELWTSRETPKRDSFVIKVLRRERYELFDRFKNHMLAKNEVVLQLDHSPSDVSEVVCWDRVFRWSFTDIILNRLNFVNAKTVVTRGIKHGLFDLVAKVVLRPAPLFSGDPYGSELLVGDRPDILF